MHDGLTTVGKIGVGIGIGLLLFWLFWSPVPATHTPYFEERTPGDLQTMRATSADLDDRLDGDAKVFTVRANYYAGSDIHHEPGTSRVWNVVNPTNVGTFGEESALYQEIHHDLTAKLRSGEIGVVVMTPRTAATIREWESTERAFKEHFCRVEPRPHVYDDVSTHIYEYVGEGQPDDCTTNITVAWGGET